MSWKIEFYDATVETNIKKWPEGMIPKFLWLLNFIEEIGPDKIGAPYVKALGHGLFKINAKNDKDVGCALFCISEKDKIIIILDVFIKTTEKIILHEMVLAKTRMNEINLKKI